MQFSRHAVFYFFHSPDTRCKHVPSTAVCRMFVNVDGNPKNYAGGIKGTFFLFWVFFSHHQHVVWRMCCPFSQTKLNLCISGLSSSSWSGVNVFLML